MVREFSFQWHITNRCNLRCLHCYQDEFSGKGELEGEDFKRLAKNIIASLKKKKAYTRINITGGEPFLKEELPWLARYLARTPLVREFNIITNATLLTPEKVAWLRQIPKLKGLKISLEGVDEASCASIRADGVFRKIVQAVERLRQNPHPDIILMFTLLKRNVGQIPRLLRLAKEWGVEGVILERFIPWGQGRDLRAEVLSAAQWQEVAGLLFDVCQLEVSEEDSCIYKAFWVRFSSAKKLHLMAATCNVGYHTCCIMPNADVYPCRRFNLAIGNLRTKSLEEIMRGSEVINRCLDKSSLKGRCKTCGIADCRGCRALAYSHSGDYLCEDPQCWYGNKA